MSLFRYVFVRHGFSYGNQEHLLAGHTDVSLTDWGMLNCAGCAAAVLILRLSVIIVPI